MAECQTKREARVESAEGEEVARGLVGIPSTSAYEAMPRRLNAGGLGRDVV